MIRKIPCSAKRIPCFRREQGIRRNALDLQFELMPKGAKTSPRRLIFRKFPDLFPGPFNSESAAFTSYAAYVPFPFCRGSVFEATAATSNGLRRVAKDMTMRRAGCKTMLDICQGLLYILIQ
jgi:hypothetical protein